MSEIKRYAVKQVREDSGGYVIVDITEHPQGEWVRWEDVKDLIPVKPRAMTSEDIQRGMEHVIKLGGTDYRHGVINGPSFVDQNKMSLKERSK